jgi:phosphoribosyl-ATP pyrophosphohydrolase
MQLRLNLIEEETHEVLCEMYRPFIPNFIRDSFDHSYIDKQNLTKELSDLIYVAIGTAVTFGLPLEEVFRRTHESNMTKDGGVREDGKVLKGEGYQPPTFEDLFNEE